MVTKEATLRDAIIKNLKLEQFLTFEIGLCQAIIAQLFLKIKIRNFRNKYSQELAYIFSWAGGNTYICGWGATSPGLRTIN